MSSAEQEFTAEMTFRLSGTDPVEVDERVGKMASEIAEQFNMDEVQHVVRPTSLEEATRQGLHT